MYIVHQTAYSTSRDSPFCRTWLRRRLPFDDRSGGRHSKAFHLRFFESKEALFLSVFKEIMKAHFAHTQKLFASLQDKTVEERLYQLLTNGLTYASEHGDAFAFYQRAMLFSPPAVQEKIRDRFLEAETWLIDVLRDCFKEGIQTGVIRETNLDDLIASFLCLLDGVLIQLFYYGPEMLRRRIDGIWRIYWSGISH